MTHKYYSLMTQKIKGAINYNSRPNKFLKVRSDEFLLLFSIDSFLMNIVCSPPPSFQRKEIRNWRSYFIIRLFWIYTLLFILFYLFIFSKSGNMFATWKIHGRIIKWTRHIGFLTLAGMGGVVEGNHRNNLKEG